MAKLKFVRVGASAPCEKCGVRFLIAAEHVRRPPPPPGHAPAVRPMPVADERRRLDDSGQVIGLSGLSEMMKREADEEAVVAPPPAPPARRTAAAGRPHVRVIRSPRLMLVLLLLGVIGVLSFSGVLVWYNAHRRAAAAEHPAVSPP